MYNEPDWAEILGVIYDENLVWSLDEDIDSDHPVVSRVDMSPEAVQRNLAFLSESGLIGRLHVGVKADISRPGKEGVIGIPETAKKHGTHVGLTEKGFSVAHQRRMQARRDQREDERIKQQEQKEDKRTRNQHNINRAIAFLTLGLMVVTVIDSAVSAFIGLDSLRGALASVVAGLILVSLFAAILYFSGLLSSYSPEE